MNNCKDINQEHHQLCCDLLVYMLCVFIQMHPRTQQVSHHYAVYFLLVCIKRNVEETVLRIYHMDSGQNVLLNTILMKI